MFNIKESGIDNSSSFHDMLHLMVPKNAVGRSLSNPLILTRFIKLLLLESSI